MKTLKNFSVEEIDKALTDLLDWQSNNDFNELVDRYFQVLDKLPIEKQSSNCGMEEYEKNLQVLIQQKLANYKQDDYVLNHLLPMLGTSVEDYARDNSEAELLLLKDKLTGIDFYEWAEYNSFFQYYIQNRSPETELGTIILRNMVPDYIALNDGNNTMHKYFIDPASDKAWLAHKLKARVNRNS